MVFAHGNPLSIDRKSALQAEWALVNLALSVSLGDIRHKDGSLKGDYKRIDFSVAGVVL